MKKIIFAFLILTTSIYAQEKFSFGINGNLSFPLGDWSKVYKTGLGGEFNFAYHLEENVYLYASIGLASWNLDIDKFNDLFSAAEQNIKFDIEAPIQAIPLLVGVKWKFYKTVINPYLLVEGGVYRYNIDLSGKYTDGAGNINIIRAINENYNETSFNFGLGFEKQIDKNIFLDFKARYHLVSSGKNYDYGDGNYVYHMSTSKFFSASLGVFFTI